jgi:hypothetical protein
VPAQRSQPATATRTSEDLKSILRSMTAHTEKKPAIQVQRAQPDISLKNTLADILKKQQVSAPIVENKKEEIKEIKKAPEVTPFEIPEETLKAIFKDQ